MKRGRAKAISGFRSRAASGAGSSRSTSDAFGGFTGGGSPLAYLAEPPDLGAVSDPNVVVALRNVLKKDATTKAKGLEELIAYAQASPSDQGGGVEEAVLDIWANIYPRTSIDNSRRVRELAHTLQYELMKSARKRMERHVPHLVGAWLAGVYDRDRVVARAASAGLSFFLTNPERADAFWRRCHSAILEFAIEAGGEGYDTLSDERSTPREDAEAKYFRVAAAHPSLVRGLLQRVRDADVEALRDRYDEYFYNDWPWRQFMLTDAYARKAAYQLFTVCLDRKLPYAEAVETKRGFITAGLDADQSGAALDYVRLLTSLTRTSPGIWTAIGSRRKNFPLSKLEVFIAKGSQGSPAKFWEFLDQLLAALPEDQVDLKAASALLAALKSGVTNREEPRTNTSFAWKCYIDTAKRLLARLSAEEQLSFAGDHFFPFFEQFLFSVAGRPVAIPLGPNAMSIFVEAYVAVVQGSEPLVDASAKEWDRLADTFCAEISSSLPEVSKEFQASQDGIGEDGRRWFGLVGHIHEKVASLGAGVPDQTAEPSKKIISQCLGLLESRNMKPFGAARAVEWALSTSSHLFVGDVGDRVAGFLLSAAEGSIKKVIQSPSSGYLLSCLQLLGTMAGKDKQHAEIWSAWSKATLDLAAEGPRNSALAALISDEKGSSLARGSPNFQDTIVSQALATVRAQADAWELLDSAVRHHALSNEAYHRLAQDLVNSLEKETQWQEDVLRALEIVVKGDPKLFSQDDEIHTSLVAQLLSLSEIGDSEVSSKTAAIRSLLDRHSDGKLPVVGIIQSSLERADLQSLEIETVVRQAQDAFDGGAALEDVFPSTNVWMQELAPFLEQPVNPSLSISSAVGGATALARSKAAPGRVRVARDRKGRSVPARMALYSSHLIDAGLDVAKLPREFQVELLYLQCLTVQLVSDQITTTDEDSLWKTLKPADAASQAESLVSSLRKFINHQISLTKWWIDTAEGKPSSPISSLVDLIIGQCRELTPRGLYCSRALSEIIQSSVEAQGLSPVLEARLLKADLLKATPATVLVAAAILSGLGQTLQASKAISNFCNRLVSDVAGASADADKTLTTLTLLTLCAQVYEMGELPVANNRIVFAVKQITGWMDDVKDLSPALCAEIGRCLAQLLPCMKDVYGSYWEKAISFCIGLWKNAGSYPLMEAIPFIHSSLRLMKTLETMPEPNDDLVDAIRDSSAAKPPAMIELLKLPRDTASQPLEIVDEMLSRELDKLPVRQITDEAELFGLVASESRVIQTAAFSLLHRAIPAQQEQKSVDVLLDKTDARLPDELLSLLLDAPTLDKYSDDMLAEFPSPIRCYLLSWKLVFDAFSTSTLKVRNDFTENLKADNYVAPLLDSMFDVLGHSAAHPLNLDKARLGPEQLKEYDMKLAETELDEKNMQWLLVHLFYLTLKYTSGLFRSWYIDCRSKQTRIAVESWTTKYFSPLIVDDTLDEVQAWADAQEAPASDEQELQVKVSKAAREVTAGYEVDESQAAIVIKIPASYPVEGVSVAGLRRVAVTERKWQSWIMTTQGVITFSNGSIVDGLQVFRRNIAGALKGQSECAICYSIISADKRMPDKRCATCKNLFHRTCLYKWFQSSSQNTCPLCRNPIDYLGADTARRRQ